YVGPVECFRVIVGNRSREFVFQFQRFFLHRIFVRRTRRDEWSRWLYRLVSSLFVSFENFSSIPCWMRWRLMSSFFAFSIEISSLIRSARSVFAVFHSLLLLKVTSGYVVCKSGMR